MSFEHSERWRHAQHHEVVFWHRPGFRDSEWRELEVKYGALLRDIEERHGFTDDTDILDLGCGATCPSLLFTRGRRAGVDPLVSEFLPDDASKLEGIELHEGTGERIPFPEASFDVVLCRNALDHMDDIEQVMSEIRRVLRPGGLALLSIYTYSRFVAFLKRTQERIPLVRNVEHPITLTPQGFYDLCASWFDVLEAHLVWEGVSSVDYGKQDVEMVERPIHKAVAWLNRVALGNPWFVREPLFVCRWTAG